MLVEFSFASYQQTIAEKRGGQLVGCLAVTFFTLSYSNGICFGMSFCVFWQIQIQKDTSKSTRVALSYALHLSDFRGNKPTTATNGEREETNISLKFMRLKVKGLPQPSLAIFQSESLTNELESNLPQSLREREGWVISGRCRGVI